jgi:hypothetical protein
MLLGGLLGHLGERIFKHFKKHSGSKIAHHVGKRMFGRKGQQEQAPEQPELIDPGEGEGHHTLIHIHHKPHYSGSLRKAFGVDDDEEPKKKKKKDYLSSLGSMMSIFSNGPTRNRDDD